MEPTSDFDSLEGRELGLYTAAKFRENFVLSIAGKIQ